MQKNTLCLSKKPITIGHDDPLWPDQLWKLPNPPQTLRVAGELPDLETAVAMVGTRYADDAALQFTREFSAAISLSGLSIISGGAYGIDAAAHEGALSISGRTIAVLATGLAKAYPPLHGPLFERIAKSGALVTEEPDNISPRPGLFLKRNRLIAALARIVIIVQAPYRSGALSTAKWAQNLGKPLLVVPSSPWNERGQGCLALIRKGAHICTTAQDVLSVLNCSEAHRKGAVHEPTKNQPTLNIFHDDEKKVVKSLNWKPIHPDEVSRKTGLPIPKVQLALLKLMLQGAVQECNGGTYIKKTVEITDGYGKEKGKSVRDEKESHSGKSKEKNRNKGFNN